MQFPTTSWTLVVAAGKSGGGEAQEAMVRLCEHYWYPLYAFLRRKGYGVEQAEDLVQGFFARLIEKQGLESARQDRGRFRSFLLASLQHSVANQHDHDRALKRGGGAKLVSLDIPRGEAQYSSEAHAATDGVTPERLYEAAWAVTVIERVMESMRTEWAASGKEAQFKILKPFLSGAGTASYAEVGERLGISEGNVRVTMHRMRKRFGQLLREEIAITVERPDQVEDELRFLLAAVSL